MNKARLNGRAFFCDWMVCADPYSTISRSVQRVPCAVVNVTK